MVWENMFMNKDIPGRTINWAYKGHDVFALQERINGALQKETLLDRALFLDLLVSGVSIEREHPKEELEKEPL